FIVKVFLHLYNKKGFSPSVKQKKGTIKPSLENLAAALGRHRQIRAAVWDHFDREEPPSKHALCRYCNTRFRADPMKNGTAGLIAHLKRC
ncbi:hypothetical protein MKW98_002704, partial [Papaver atlanticum]